MMFYKDGKPVKELGKVNYLLDGFVWVKGYEGLYMVNRDGIVITVKRKHTKPTHVKKPYLRENSKNYKYKETNYYNHSFSKKRVYTEKGLHRLLAESFIPNPENKEEVNHIDGNTLNNSLDNLEWVTKSENQKHAFATGLNKTTEKVRACGRVNGRKRRSLSFEDAEKIRELHNSGVCMNDISAMYSKPYYTIYRIIKNETYINK